MHSIRLLSPAHAPRAEPRPSLLPRRLVPDIPLHALALTLLLAVSVGILWMNLAWVTGLWQVALLAYAGVAAMLWPARVPKGKILALGLACAIPLWGTLQMATGRAAYGYATLLSVIAWTTVPAGFLLGLIVLRDQKVRDAFLQCLWVLAAAVTVLELYQRLVLGRYSVMSSGYPLISSNLYAELAELLLPAVLATAIRKGSNLWLGCGLSALMLATTVAAGARMGTVLLVLETVAVLVATRKAAGYRKLAWRKQGVPLVVLLLLVVGLEGTSGLSGRLRETDPLEGRAEVLHSAMQMIHQHPLAGYGLGAFPVVYPQFARLQTTSYINHVHNDYVELAVDGGIVALLLWLALLAVTLPSLLRAPWAFGIIAMLFHGLTDFPLYRAPVVALMAFLLAAATTRRSNNAASAFVSSNH